VGTHGERTTIVELGGLEKVNMNKKIEFCDNNYFLCFNIYSGIIIISLFFKIYWTHAANYNIKKISKKNKKNKFCNNNYFYALIYIEILLLFC
jgi:low temperature requirement protein LtrA